MSDCRFIAAPDPSYPRSAREVPAVAWCMTHQRPAAECNPTTDPQPETKEDVTRPLTKSEQTALQAALRASVAVSHRARRTE